MRMKFIFAAMALAVALPAAAAIKTEAFEYMDGETVLDGYIAFDDAAKGKKPGVLIVHDWMGSGESTQEIARKIASLGYVGFAVDVYGKGVRPKDAGEAGKLAGGLKKDLPLMRSRIRAAFDTLAKRAHVDANRIAVMGYCFGGTVSLELARSGAPITGAVSFHGGLSTANADDAKNIKGKILVLHGADDSYVPAAEVQAFMEEMRKAKTDWQFVAYGNAVHAFTNKKAGNDNSKGAAYEERADRRSWIAMQNFFSEIFAPKP
jgi:dienelactone hydrolase